MGGGGGGKATLPLSSVHNRRLSAARRLRRQPGEWLLAEGPQVVVEALRARADVGDVFVTPAALERHSELLTGAHTTVVSEQAIRGLAGTEAPQGIVAVVRNPAVTLEALLGRGPQRLLVLTDVRDPGNVGTALRAAEGAGLDGAVVCAGSCDPANAKAVRASAGAVFHLRHAAGVLPIEALDALVGFTRLGAQAADARPFDDVIVSLPVAAAVGNEAWGFTPEVASRLDALVSIPMRGHMGSLNAGVAAALLSYRIMRP